MRIETFGANNILGMNDLLNKLNCSNNINSDFANESLSTIDIVEIGQDEIAYKTYSVHDFNIKSSTSSEEDAFENDIAYENDAAEDESSKEDGEKKNAQTYTENLYTNNLYNLLSLMNTAYIYVN